MSRAATSLQLGTLKLKNRMILAPVKTALHGLGGAPTEAASRYYQRMGEGGAALLILEPAAVHPRGAEHPRQLRSYGDPTALRQAVAAGHAGGALVAVHLNHAGRAANPKVIGGAPLAFTSTACAATGATPELLDENALIEILEGFRQGARRAAEVGADAIELQAGHGYLLAQALAHFGPDAPFPRAVLAAVLEAGLPVILRVSGSEYVENGLGPAQILPFIHKAGAMGVVALHVGMGNACESAPWYYGHMSLPTHPQDAALSALREGTALPLLVAGRMGDETRIEAMLSSGLADGIALGRALIADPDFPRKITEGRAAELLRCGGCLQACLKNVKQGAPISCIVNDWVDQLHTPPPPAPLGRGAVAVAGSGPAGAAAALALAERGFEVAIFEKETLFGGQFALAARAPGKERLHQTLDSVRSRLRRAGVAIHLGETLQNVASPYLAVVDAAGSAQAIPPIPGLDAISYRTSLEVIRSNLKNVGNRVLVIGAGMVGVEVAHALLQRGHEVVAVEQLAALPEHVDPMGSTIARKKLASFDRFTLLLGASVAKIGALSVDVQQGEQLLALQPFDTVILATGMRPLAEEAHVKGEIPVLRVADAGTIEGAWRAGLAAGRSLILSV